MRYVVFLLLLVPIFTFSQEKKYLVTKTIEQMEVDGIGNESIWSTVPKIEDFIQNFPQDSIAAISKTTVQITFDDQNIYILAHCVQPQPYVVNNLIRDFSFPISDAFAVFISPRRDQTNGFSFSVNPYGAQREGIVSNGGNFGVTTAWDQKWFSAATTDNNSYTIEMAIPFKTLRYEQDNLEWDINFARNNLALNEQSTWSSIPLGFNVATLNKMGSIEFSEELPKSGANVAIIPYVSFGGAFQYDGSNVSSRDNLSKAGVDAKVAVTSSLNLDITINPDFSNVQVDQQVINLDRFSIFFPERRNFFTENSDLFANFGFSRIRPFFSRRIGLNQGQQVNILGGLRLSGNVTDNTRIGLMNIQSEGVGGDVQLESQNYTVAAVQQKVFGRSNIGAILVNRQAFNGFKTIKGDRNTIAGVDFNLFSDNNKWRGKVFYHQQFEDKLEIAKGAQAAWLAYNTTNWSINYNHEFVGEEYNAEVGFVPRRDGYFRFEHSVGYSWYPENRPKVIKHQLETYYSQYWTALDFSTDRFNGFEYNIDFSNTSGAGIGFYDQRVRLTEGFDVVGKGTPIEAGTYAFREAEIYYASNFRKPFNYVLELSYGSFYNGNKLSYSGSINYRWRPKASLGVFVERNELRFPEPYENGYLTLIGTDFNISFSTKVLWSNFFQYNTQAKNFNINSRLQWRFAPQSDIFFVYTDNYTDDFRPKSKAFVLRMNYWFGI